MEIYQNYLENLSGNILLGCDGFVDEVYEIVAERRSLTDYSAIDHLKTFGQHIVDRAEGGVGLELVHKRRCEGGFAINTGRVAGMLGLQPRILGLFGEKELDPVFDVFTDICQITSLGEPALTLAFEFVDGKILLSDPKTVANLTWREVEAKLGEDGLAQLFRGVDALGLGYWSLTPDFDNMLTGFVSQYGAENAPKRMFFDFADIKKKAKASFTDSLVLLAKFNQKIPMTLSVNEHEIMELFTRIGVECTSYEPEAITAGMEKALALIGINELVVHTPKFGAASHVTDGTAFAMQETQTKVIRTAGAGDTFNGGYLCAAMGGLPIKQRLAVANASTAFFVTHACPPKPEELLEQLAKASDK